MTIEAQLSNDQLRALENSKLCECCEVKCNQPGQNTFYFHDECEKKINEVISPLLDTMRMACPLSNEINQKYSEILRIDLINAIKNLAQPDKIIDFISKYPVGYLTELIEDMGNRIIAKHQNEQSTEKNLQKKPASQTMTFGYFPSSL